MPESPSDVQLDGARAFLIERFGIDGNDVEYVGEGAWSRCFGFTHNGAELVVRFGRHVEDFERDRLAARFASADLPIPQVIEIDEAFGAWYCVSTRARGTPLEQLDAAEWTTTMPVGARDAGRPAQGRYHRDLRLRALGRRRQGTARHPGRSSWRLSSRIAPTRGRTGGSGGCSIRPTATKRSCAATNRCSISPTHSRARAASSTTTCSIATHWHAGGRVTSVFDWGCSMYGDFVYELATIVFWSPWYAAIEASDMTSRALDHYGDMGLDVPNFDARLRCCALHIGLVHIAYNAFLGDLDTLRLTDRRMRAFLD